MFFVYTLIAMNGAPDRKSDKTVLDRHFAACRMVLWCVLGFSFISNILMLALPIYSLQVLDRVVSSGSTDTLLMLSLIVLAALWGLSLIQMARSYILVKTGAWLDKRLSPILFAYSIKNSVATENRLSGSQSIRDLNTIKNFLTGSGLVALLDSPWSLIYVLILFAIHPVVGSITLMGGILLLILAVANEKTTKNILGVSNEIFARSMSKIESSTRNAEVISAMGMTDNIIRNWQDDSQVGIDMHTLAGKRSAILSGLSRFLRLVIQIAVVGISGYMVLQNEMTLGAIIASSILASRALAPLESSISSWKGVIAARKSRERLEKVFDGEDVESKRISLPTPTGKLSVNNVVVAFDGNRKYVLRNVSLQLSPGEILGIIGPSAAGKSSLAKVITGVWKPLSGEVRLDGADICKWDRNDFGKHVGYLPQDVELFDGSVKENIARMDPDAEDVDVIKAATIAGVHDLILSLPDSYETQIGVGGAVLSGGQRQRIGLARAFYGNPKLVVLDEPGANLDNEGEKALVRALRYAKQNNITTIMVSHRPSIMPAVDKIVVLQNGVVAGFGPRDEILTKLNQNIGNIRPANDPELKKPDKAAITGE